LIAVVAADVRSDTPILSKIFFTCVFTVFSLTSSANAISFVRHPANDHPQNIRLGGRQIFLAEVLTEDPRDVFRNVLASRG
jgi:hypothetical protein